MASRKLSITTDNTPTLCLLLSATTAMRGHRWALRIPFNNLEYDDRPGQQVRPFNVKGLSFKPPAGTRLLAWSTYRNVTTADVRNSVAAGLDLLLECDDDATALDDVSLTLFFDGIASEIASSIGTIAMPAVTGTTGTPWTLTDATGAIVAPAITMLPAAAGARDYKGTWNAATNSPALASGTGFAGDTYVVSTAGSTLLDGISDWQVGDEVSFNGEVWQKIPVNTGVLRVANNLSDVSNTATARGNLGLKSFAVKEDAEATIDVEGLSGTRSLTTSEVSNEILHVVGKPAGDLTLKLPSGKKGTWSVINDTTGSKTLDFANTGGQLGALAIALRPGTNPETSEPYEELFVLNQTSQTISVLHSATGAVLRTLTPSGLGLGYDLAFSPDGSVLYITVPVNSDSGVVKLINPEDGTSAGANLITPPTPRGLLVDEVNDALWVSCSGTPVQIQRFNLTTGVPYDPITPEDPIDTLDTSYGAWQFAPTVDGSIIYFFGRIGRGHPGTGQRYAFAIDPATNVATPFRVGSQPHNNSGGLAINENYLFISYGGRSLAYFDASAPGTVLGGLSVGNRANFLLLIANTLYASNMDDRTLSVYSTTDFSESPLIRLDYAPGQIINNGAGKIWVVFPSNNAVGLVDPATRITERLVALGALEPLVLRAGVTEVKSDGSQLWALGDPESLPEAPVIQGTRLLDVQDYFERGILDVAQSRFPVWSLTGYTSSNSTAVPYARVVRTIGARRDTFRTNYIPVQRGAKLRVSAWLMRPTAVTGTAGNFALQLLLFDRDRRPAGTAGVISNFPVADGTWRELSSDYVLPLTHTPIDNSDGGPICYIQVAVTVNGAPSGNPVMQELQWGAVRIDYADTARTQTLFVNAATATATVQCGSGSFTVAPDATASTVQTAIRAAPGNESVVVTGGTTEGETGEFSGSFLFTWPPGITPAPLVVTVPTDETWTTQINLEGVDAQSIQGIQVAQTAPTDGQVLIYNAATEQYEPAAQSGGDGVEITAEPYAGDGDAIEVTAEPGSDLATIALTGSYNDLTDKPTLGTAAARDAGVSNGVAELDASGFVPLSQLPSAVLGAVHYQGTWNATSNSPAIPTAGSGNQGYYYRVATAGATAIDGISEWAVGDWIISNGTAWEKVDNTDAVTSVAGRTGAVTLTKTDVGLGNVDNTADTAKPVSTAQQTALDDKLSITATRSANTVLAGPTTGSAAAPSFRALVPADLPDASGSQKGAMSSAHYTLLNNATATNSNSTLVQRDSSGNTALNAATLGPGTGSLLLNFSGDTTTGIGRLSSQVLSFYAGNNRNMDITSSQVSMNALLITNSHTRINGGLRVGSTAGPTNNGSGGITGTFLNLGDIASNALVYVGGNISSASWTTSGIGLSIPSSTYTDTSSAGTVAHTATHAIAAPTLASTNARTHTIASTLRVAGPPTAGTNTTITSPTSLFVESGNSVLAGYVGVGPNVTPTDMSSAWQQFVIKDTSTTNVGLKLISSNSSGSLQLGTGGMAINRTLTLGELGTAASLTLSGTTANTTGVTARAQDNTATFQTQATSVYSWVDSTQATRKSRVIHSVYDTAAREAMRMEASGTAPMIGFLGASAVVRQTLSAAATDAATTQTLVNDIRTALINLGLAS